MLEHAERFVVDYLRPKKPPPGARWSRCGRRPPGCGLGTMAASPLTVEARGPAGALPGGLPGAEAGGGEQDFIQAILAAEVGDAKGSTGARASRCRYGSRSGRVTVDARAAVAGMVERLAGVVDRETLERAAAEAIADATKKGTTTDPGAGPRVGPKASRPRVLAAMKEEESDERDRNSGGQEPRQGADGPGRPGASFVTRWRGSYRGIGGDAAGT